MDDNGPDYIRQESDANFLKQTKEGAIIQSDTRPTVMQLQRKAKVSTKTGLKFNFLTAC